MRFLTAVTLGICAVAPSSAVHAQGKPNGFVYTMSNATENQILGFTRAPGGSLGEPFRVNTGGQGTGQNLGSDNALVLSPDGRWLLAVNAGSNTISLLERHRGVLTLRMTVASGGTRPESIALSGDLVYVLNNGGTANISGFFLDDDRGQLHPIQGSTRELSSAAPDAPQIAFDNTGEVLVVTEKKTNLIDSFLIQADATPSRAVPNYSNGATPFGVAFDRRNNLIVSEAFGGAPLASALSSYQVDFQGRLDTISASVPTGQSAACWVVVTSDGRYAYTSDTGNGVITGYRVARDGRLTLLQQNGLSARTGGADSKPVDLALTRRSEFLYSVNSGTGTLFGWYVKENGELERLPGGKLLPLSATGLVAR